VLEDGTGEAAATGVVSDICTILPGQGSGATSKMSARINEDYKRLQNRSFRIPEDSVVDIVSVTNVTV
jgi:hypothetical protein